LLWLISKVHGGGDDFKRADRILTMRFCGSLLGSFGGVVSNIAHVQEVVSAPAAIFHATAREHAPPVKLTETSTPSRESGHGEPGNFKVQGIIYRPADPSAIVIGITVFIGDRVGHAKVIAIDRNAVTLEPT